MAVIHDAGCCAQASVNGTPTEPAGDEGRHSRDRTTPPVVDIMVTAGRQLARTTSLSHVRPGDRPKGWRRRALFILQGLPNVGPARAQALLEAFGSVGAVMSANTDMLAGVKGIGVGAATSIARAIGDEPAQSIGTLSKTPDREWPHRLYVVAQQDPELLRAEPSRDDSLALATLRVELVQRRPGVGETPMSGRAPSSPGPRSG
jgi:hypothetical protein